MFLERHSERGEGGAPARDWRGAMTSISDLDEQVGDHLGGNVCHVCRWHQCEFQWIVFLRPCTGYVVNVFRLGFFNPPANGQEKYW